MGNKEIWPPAKPGQLIVFRWMVQTTHTVPVSCLFYSRNVYQISAILSAFFKFIWMINLQDLQAIFFIQILTYQKFHVLQ